MFASKCGQTHGGALFVFKPLLSKNDRRFFYNLPPNHHPMRSSLLQLLQEPKGTLDDASVNSMSSDLLFTMCPSSNKPEPTLASLLSDTHFIYADELNF